jgi:hypothetical protein
MQIYRKMDIGTAKATPEERRRAPHHLIDFLDPRESYSVEAYRRDAELKMSEIISRGKLPVFVGGTGLYLDSVLFGVGGEESKPDLEYRASLEALANEKGVMFVHSMLAEIDPDGTKPVFVVGHLSAICYYKEEKLSESMINGNRELFYDIFKGHKNAFYLYGHIHGEGYCYKNYSSGAVLHIDAECKPLDANLCSEDSRGKDYEFTFVHMGGLRPFGKQYFDQDGLTGYGGNSEPKYHTGTATPRLAQYMVLEVYPDRAVFYIRNTGDYEGYHRDDKLLPYTVYFKKEM